MTKETWAEAIEKMSPAQQESTRIGPFIIYLGFLTTMTDLLIREPKDGAKVPAPWPVARAPGWRKYWLNPRWPLMAWCALGGEWFFRSLPFDQKHTVQMSGASSAERRARISKALQQEPGLLLTTGEVFPFCDSLFVVPEETFAMNSFSFHVDGREPLPVFLGYRGHARPYSEIITPGVYRAHNNPDVQTSQKYFRKARVASNVVKQAVFEQANMILSNVQARGVLQHYGIIGPTDILDLSYDVNVAKWFSLNLWGGNCYILKHFVEHNDPDKALSEYSVVYTVVVRSIGTFVPANILGQISDFDHLTFKSWNGDEIMHEELRQLPPRNLSPLWSTRAERQSGFGLASVGPRDDDAWGGVLSISEHRFHPTFSPNGWDRIGGAKMFLGGRSYRWDEDTSVLGEHTLPADDKCIQWIRKHVGDLERRLNL